MKGAIIFAAIGVVAAIVGVVAGLIAGDFSGMATNTVLAMTNGAMLWVFTR